MSKAAGCANCIFPFSVVVWDKILVYLFISFPSTCHGCPALTRPANLLSHPRRSFLFCQARQDITSAAEELAAVRLTKKEADEALLGKDKENNKVSQ